MEYEETPITNNTKAINLEAANELSTRSLLWLIIKRHHTPLLIIGNVVLVLNWAIPEWVQIVKSII